MEIVLPVLILAGVGLIAGAVLSVASRVFYVETDETVTNLLDILPMANCGACGYSGCEAYAVALSDGTAQTNLCKPGGEAVSVDISKLLGKDVLAAIREVAYVRCNGNCDATKQKFDYQGVQTCTAASRFYSGRGSCDFGCEGYGDCAVVCEYDAISVVNGVAEVDAEKCTGCMKCVKECPKKIIAFRKDSQTIDVRCSSHDLGKVVRTICKNGCIACKICEKKCAFDAIHVVDNLASIDYQKCTLCGECVKACPAKCIQNYSAAI